MQMVGIASGNRIKPCMCFVPDPEDLMNDDIFRQELIHFVNELRVGKICFTIGMCYIVFSMNACIRPAASCYFVFYPGKCGKGDLQRILNATAAFLMLLV